MILQMKEHGKEHNGIFRFSILNIAGLRQKKKDPLCCFFPLKSEKAERVYDY